MGSNHGRACVGVRGEVSCYDRACVGGGGGNDSRACVRVGGGTMLAGLVCGWGGGGGVKWAAKSK
jgi:hypothetical protein